nr:hypothetical protein [Shewanella sp.]
MLMLAVSASIKSAKIKGANINSVNIEANVSANLCPCCFY